MNTYQIHQDSRGYYITKDGEVLGVYETFIDAMAAKHELVFGKPVNALWGLI